MLTLFVHDENLPIQVEKSIESWILIPPIVHSTKLSPSDNQRWNARHQASGELAIALSLTPTAPLFTAGPRLVAIPDCHAMHE